MGLVAMTGSVTKATRSSEPAIELMVTGVIGLLLSLLFWSSFSPYRRRVGPTLSDERVVEERRIERDLP